MALGPVAKAFFLDTNFSRNEAARWGADVFVGSPADSSLYFNHWPPPAAIFPAEAQANWWVGGGSGSGAAWPCGSGGGATAVRGRLFFLSCPVVPAEGRRSSLLWSSC